MEMEVHDILSTGGNRSTNGDFNLSNEIAYVLIPTTRIHHKTL
jgi:hypothetical protein